MTDTMLTRVNQARENWGRFGFCDQEAYLYSIGLAEPPPLPCICDDRCQGADPGELSAAWAELQAARKEEDQRGVDDIADYFQQNDCLEMAHRVQELFEARQALRARVRELENSQPARGPVENCDACRDAISEFCTFHQGSADRFAALSEDLRRKCMDYLRQVVDIDPDRLARFTGLLSDTAPQPTPPETSRPRHSTRLKAALREWRQFHVCDREVYLHSLGLAPQPDPCTCIDWCQGAEPTGVATAYAELHAAIRESRPQDTEDIRLYLHVSGQKSMCDRVQALSGEIRDLTFQVRELETGQPAYGPEADCEACLHREDICTYHLGDHAAYDDLPEWLQQQIFDFLKARQAAEAAAEQQRYLQLIDKTRDKIRAKAQN